MYEYLNRQSIGLIKTNTFRGRRGRDRMVVGFTAIYAISAYHY